MDKSSTKWAEYTLLDPPQHQLARYDDNRSRFYWWVTADENNNPIVNTAIGITSLLSLVLPTSHYLTKWKLDNENWSELLDDSSAYGTLLHSIYYEWLVNKNIPSDLLEAARILAIRNGGGYDMPEKNILSFLKFCEDVNLQPLLIEAMILSPVIEGQQYAMTIDILCEINTIEESIVERKDGFWQRGEKKGQPKIIQEKVKTVVRKKAILDYKSNFFDKDRKSFFISHKYQLMAAQRGIVYNYPDIEVALIGNFSPNAWRTNPSYTLQWWDVTDKDNEKFDAYLKIGLLEGYFKPSGNIFVPPEFKEGVKSDSFKMLPYEEFIKMKYLDNTPTQVLEGSTDTVDNGLPANTEGEQENSGEENPQSPSEVIFGTLL